MPNVSFTCVLLYCRLRIWNVNLLVSVRPVHQKRWEKCTCACIVCVHVHVHTWTRACTYTCVYMYLAEFHIEYTMTRNFGGDHSEKKKLHMYTQVYPFRSWYVSPFLTSCSTVFITLLLNNDGMLQNIAGTCKQLAFCSFCAHLLFYKEHFCHSVMYGSCSVMYGSARIAWSQVKCNVVILYGYA